MKKYFMEAGGSQLVAVDDETGVVSIFNAIAAESTKTPQHLPTAAPSTNPDSRCQECKKPKRHAKWCSKRETGGSTSGSMDKPKRVMHCKICGEAGHIAKTCPQRAGLSPLDVRTVLRKSQYNACKTAHFKGGVSADHLRINYPDAGLDEIKRALASQNYEEYVA
jgi:hypothetical protein